MHTLIEATLQNPFGIVETLPLPIFFAAMGTLKTGGSNNRLLSDSLYIGDGQTLPVYGMKSLGGFPSLIEGSSKVKVEIFRISPETLSRLDQLEGYNTQRPMDSFFTREIVPIEIKDDDGSLSTLDCWLYYVANPLSISDRPDWTETDKDGCLNWYHK